MPDQPKDQPKLEKQSFANGVWEGLLSGVGSATPDLEVLRDGAAQEGLTLTVAAGNAQAWNVRFVLPSSALGDQAALYAFRLKGSADVLADIAIYNGETLQGDIRAELNALRAELDLVKTVLRRDVIKPSKA